MGKLYINDTESTQSIKSFLRTPTAPSPVKGYKEPKNLEPAQRQFHGVNIAVRGQDVNK
jgi:hypothetical protein